MFHSLNRLGHERHFLTYERRIVKYETKNRPPAFEKLLVDSPFLPYFSDLSTIYFLNSFERGTYPGHN